MEQSKRVIVSHVGDDPKSQSKFTSQLAEPMRFFPQDSARQASNSSSKMFSSHLSLPSLELSKKSSHAYPQDVQSVYPFPATTSARPYRETTRAVSKDDVNKCLLIRSAVSWFRLAVSLGWLLNSACKRSQKEGCHIIWERHVQLGEAAICENGEGRKTGDKAKQRGKSDG